MSVVKFELAPAVDLEIVELPAGSFLMGGDQGYCVQRGGSWLDRASNCRSAFRVGGIAHNNERIVGLRVCPAIKLNFTKKFPETARRLLNCFFRSNGIFR